MSDGLRWPGQTSVMHWPAPGVSRWPTGSIWFTYHYVMGGQTMAVQWSNAAYAIALQTTPYGGPVPCAVGLPGAAKTAWTRALSRMSNRQFLQVVLRQKTPEDIGGIPVPSDITLLDGTIIRGVTYLLSEEMLRAIHEPSIMLLDELNHAGHDVLGAAQELINSPPPACWMGAAMNPVASSTAGMELAPPVVNRMCILNWERPNRERRAGWLNGFRNYPDPPIPIVPTDFLDVTGPMWGQIMCDFEQDNLDLFGDDAYPKDVNKACDPWPSDRSWTHVGILLSACESVGAGSSVRAALVNGCVGDAAGTQFMQWLSRRDLPDYENILALPHTLELPARYDMSRAIIGGVFGVVRSNLTPSRWESAYDVLEEAWGQQKDTAVSMEGQLWKMKPEGYLPKDRNGSAAEMRKLRLGL